MRKAAKTFATNRSFWMSRAYRCIAQLRHNFGEMESKLYAGFSQDEQDQLKALLLRLLENISE